MRQQVMRQEVMRHGDFTALAEAYVHRPAYADCAIDALQQISAGDDPGIVVADIGAGTGKFTSMLDARGLSGFAIEPNDAMRAEGEVLPLKHFEWRKGAAEKTGLADESVDWVTMASAFHWTDAAASLREFHRILRPGGAVTLLWNPRDLEHDPLQTKIEARIAEIAPHIQRRSSGARAYTQDIEQILTKGGLFKDVLQIEAPQLEIMNRDRHMGAWRSVNDIRAQAGEEAFSRILDAIEEELGDCTIVHVRYRTRSWTARKV